MSEAFRQGPLGAFRLLWQLRVLMPLCSSDGTQVTLRQQPKNLQLMRCLIGGGVLAVSFPLGCVAKLVTLTRV